MVTNAIVFKYEGEFPPANTPRSNEEQAPPPSVTVVVSPKSVAFPVVAIVTKSIVFTLLPVLPPPNKPRV